MRTTVQKAPALLIVLIETKTLRWLVAAIGLDGNVLPLLRSEAGDLSAYQQLNLDEQVSFLRHRLSGALQRGCNQLWTREMKPCQIVFLTDGKFSEGQAGADLAQRLAEHFVQWMTKPTVAFFEGDFTSAGQPLRRLAGDLAPSHQRTLLASLEQLLAERHREDRWQLVPPKSAE